MKKHLPAILAGLACLLAAICLYQISLLRDEIQRTRSDVNSQLSHVTSRVEGISGTVRASLEEQASLLTASAYELGEIDTEAWTVRLHCTVTPKAYTPGVTRATLYANGQEHAMALEGSAFATQIDVPLFNYAYAQDFQVVLEENGRLYTERLDWWLDTESLWPQVRATMSGSSSALHSDGALVYKYNSTVDLEIDGKAGADSMDVQSAALIAMLDGEEIDRKPMECDVEHQHYWLPLEESYTIPYGSRLELYAVVQDSYGLYYVQKIDQKDVGETGAVSNDEPWRMYYYASIYDADGTPLFGEDIE